MMLQPIDPTKFMFGPFWVGWFPDPVANPPTQADIALYARLGCSEDIIAVALSQSDHFYFWVLDQLALVLVHLGYTQPEIMAMESLDAVRAIYTRPLNVYDTCIATFATNLVTTCLDDLEHEDWEAAVRILIIALIMRHFPLPLNAWTEAHFDTFFTWYVDDHAGWALRLTIVRDLVARSLAVLAPEGTPDGVNPPASSGGVD